MKSVKVKCANCKNPVLKTTNRFNEAKKFGWRIYCNLQCQHRKLDKRKYLRCNNPKCRKEFRCSQKELKRSKYHYCSRSCSATTNNSKYPKRKARVIKNQCFYCKKLFYKDRESKYCTTECKFGDQIINKDKILSQIKYFFKENGRIPFKKEFPGYSAARNRFGSWNKAVAAAGFLPNPVMFAEKHTANDGHRCDSMAEKIIDDWLTDNKIKHSRGAFYPNNNRLTCDFKIKDYYIEFFGLENEHKRYTELVNEKRRLAKKYELNLVEIKPADVYPQNKLKKILGFLK